VRRTASESIVDVEKRVSVAASLPNAQIAIRSLGDFPATNWRAPLAASASGEPIIDRERSMQTTTLFEEPRFLASRPATGRPFSSSVGGVCDEDGLTTVSSTCGNRAALACLTSPAPSAAAGTTRAATKAARTTRLTGTRRSSQR
jgi:hypothetical protein